MMGEDTPLLHKSSRIRHEKKELARDFDALKDGKLRRYNFYVLFGLSTVVTGIILLLLTPLGCIVKSFLNNAVESVTIFAERDIFGLSYKRYLDGNPLESSLNITGETLRIVLLGDSLINKPYQMHDLSGKMQYYLSQYPYTLNFINCGFNGNTIAAIKGSPLTDCALSASPHAVILFWDSDCSNVSEYLMTESEVSATRSTYAGNVALVVDALVQSGAFVAIAGTGVLGEGKKLFKPSESARFKHKEGMLNDYNTMNEVVATKYHIPFINVRQAFLEYIPFYQLCYSKCVTFDGEHENERGTVIVAKLFSATLSGWLSS